MCICSAGSSTGEVFLWRFGQSNAVSGYTPMASSGAAPSAGAGGSLFTSPMRSWHLAPGVAASQWGQPQAVRSLYLHPNKLPFMPRTSMSMMSANRKTYERLSYCRLRGCSDSRSIMMLLHLNIFIEAEAYTLQLMTLVHCDACRIC